VLEVAGVPERTIEQAREPESAAVENASNLTRTPAASPRNRQPGQKHRMNPRLLTDKLVS